MLMCKAKAKFREKVLGSQGTHCPMDVRFAAMSVFDMETMLNDIGSLEALETHLIAQQGDIEVVFLWAMKRWNHFMEFPTTFALSKQYRVCLSRA